MMIQEQNNNNQVRVANVLLHNSQQQYQFSIPSGFEEQTHQQILAEGKPLQNSIFFQCTRQRDKSESAAKLSTKFWFPNLYNVVKGNKYCVKLVFHRDQLPNFVSNKIQKISFALLDSNFLPLKEGEAAAVTSVKVKGKEPIKFYSIDDYLMVETCLKINWLSSQFKNHAFILKCTVKCAVLQSTQDLEAFSVPFTVISRAKRQVKRKKVAAASSSSIATSEIESHLPNSTLGDSSSSSNISSPDWDSLVWPFISTSEISEQQNDPSAADHPIQDEETMEQESNNLMDDPF